MKPDQQTGGTKKLRAKFQALKDLFRAKLTAPTAEEPLDEDAFNANLGQPAGVDFALDEGKLRYMITGMDEDLVGDHALEAHETSLTPDEICIT